MLLNQLCLERVQCLWSLTTALGAEWHYARVMLRDLFVDGMHLPSGVQRARV